MKQLKTIVVLLLMIIAVTAVYQNITPIKGKTITLGLDLTKYVGTWHTDPIPLGFVIVLCFLAGTVIMACVNIPVWLGNRKKIKALESELASYRPEGFAPVVASEDEAPDEPDEDKENA